MLVKEMLIEADGIIQPDHKQHRVHRPNMPIGIQQSHLVVWHKDDRNCIICSSPGKRKRTNFKCDIFNVYVHPFKKQKLLSNYIVNKITRSGHLEELNF